MKKVIYTIFALSTVMACSKMSEGKQEVPQVNDEQTTSEILPGVKYEEFTINTESQTKTVLDGLSCKWSVGDKLSVITNYEGQTTSNSFAMAPGQTDGVFSGQVPEGTTEFFAVYGNGSSYNMANGNLSATVTVPTTQTAVKDGFDPDAHIAVGYGVKQAEGASSAHLANFIRLVMVSVPENVTSVTLSSDTAIAGSMTLNCTSEGALTMSGNANANSVTINASNDVIEPGTYYLCVAPVDMVGFQMVYTFTDGSTYTKTSEKTLAMASSTQIRNLKLTIPAPTAADLAPKFFTTYNYAKGNEGATKNISKANSMANTAFDEKGIIFKNGWNNNNADSFRYTLDGSSERAFTQTISVSDWKAYTITVSASLGCQKVTSSAATRYITGLPYAVSNFSNEAGNWDSTQNVTAFKADGIYLYTGTGTPKCTLKKTFLLPESTSVNVKGVLSKSSSTLSSYETYIQLGSIKVTTGVNKTGINKKEYSGNGNIQGEVSLVASCSYGLANLTYNYAVNAIDLKYR